MALPILDPSAQGVSLMELTKLSAMMAGAVAGAVVGWLSRRHIMFSIYAFLLGIMGGMLVGTGMGNLIYVSRDGAESMVRVGCCSIFPALGGGVAGSLPTAFLVAIVVGIMALRHLKPRPPRVRTVFTGFVAGVVMGTLTAVVVAVI
ncbi:MAG: hypothetical protein WCO42_04765 [bacterium]